MDLIPFPTLRPYEVWFWPSDRTPLRIGAALAHYDEACLLAQDAARELPAYGLARGYVLVVWVSSGLKILNTFPLDYAPRGSAQHQGIPGSARPRRELVRLVLEDLRLLTSLADPGQAAPREWINRLHAVLRVIATPASQRRYGLDGLCGVTVEDLHRSVSGVLRHFERLGVEAMSASRGAGEVQLLRV